MASISSSFSSPSKEQQNVLNINHIKYFIVKNVEGTFSTVSPFLIQKSIQTAVGEVKSIKKLKSGDLLIETYSHKQSQMLLKCTSFGSLKITVSPHKSLNQSRGVVSEPDLLYTSENEILENLNNQGVLEVRRITIRRDGKILPTKHIILTFNSPEIPKHVKAAYLNCKVKPYVPNPLRCYKCQRFGHAKDACRGTVTCAKCAQTGHESETCNNNLKCVNCQGDHPSFSRSCSKWLAEKEIQTLKVTQKISYHEARRLIQSRTPTIGLAYSTVAATSLPKKTVSVETQTILYAHDVSRKLAHKTQENPQNSNSYKPTPQSSATGSSKSSDATSISVLSQKPLTSSSVIITKPLNTSPPSKSFKLNTNRSEKNNSSPTRQKVPKYMRNRFDILQEDNYTDIGIDAQSNDQASMDITEDNMESDKSCTNAQVTSLCTTTKRKNSPTVKGGVKYNFKLAHKFLRSRKKKEDEPLALYTSDIDE